MAAEANVDPLQQLLALHGVQTAVVVDNAFDLRITESVAAEALADFALEIEADARRQEEIQAAGIDVQAVNRGEEPALLQLVTHIESLQEARPAAEALLSEYLEERRPLDTLVAQLKDLGLQVILLGAFERIPEDLEAQIAFIDYYLEQSARTPGLDADGARDHAAQARARARQIYEQTRAFIVLMSSREAVSGHETAFRRDARLLRGYFRFEPKSKLSDKDGLRACIAAMPLEADFRHTLHDFIDALERRSIAICNEFMREVRELGLEDYAHLRQLSLKDEGHPFGDYTIRLFGAFLTSLVFEDAEIIRFVALLDQTTFDAFLPICQEPSLSLGRIYLASLTEKLREPLRTGTTEGPDGENAQPNGEAGESTPGEPETEPPADAGGAAVAVEPRKSLIPVEFGDLFVKDVDSPVFAVMNPVCDLPVGPKRSRMPDDTLLLFPGRLRHLHQPYEGDRPPTFFTPIYSFNNLVFRIDWDYRRMRTIHHCELPSLLSQGYQCERRLQFGPALELQQHFTSSIGRVGLAVPPPLRRSVDATVYCRGPSGEWAGRSETICNCVVVLHMRDKDQFVLNIDGRDQLTEAIAQHAQALSQEPESTAWTASGNRKQYANQLKQAATKWAHACPFHRVPGDLPRGRSGLKTWSEKSMESHDRLGVALDLQSFRTSTKVDVVLVLDLGPMPMDASPEGEPREMEQL